MKSIFEDRHLPEVISSQLANKPLKPAPDPWPEDFFDSPPRPAAVLMPLIRETDGWHLLFVRRSEHEKDRHSRVPQHVHAFGNLSDVINTHIVVAAMDTRSRSFGGITPQGATSWQL